MSRRSGAVILYVEENSTLLRTVCDVLEFAGWYVRPCSDIGMGYALIESREHFDLLLVAHNRFDIGGLQLIKHTRRQPHRQRTPLVFLSLEDRGDEARRAGANAFLRKPNNLIDLVDTIRQLLAAPAAEESRP